jgi:hypothetical protein
MLLEAVLLSFFFSLSVAIKLGWALHIAFYPYSRASTTSPKDYGSRECRIYGLPKQASSDLFFPLHFLV